MSASRRVVALFRKASFSPNQHRTNDTAILEETLARVIASGWSVTRIDESALEAAADPETRMLPADFLPEAELYLNMCQGPAAATALGALEATGACILNRPSSVLACHRHRLVPAMIAAGIPFPPTAIADLAAATAEAIAASPLLRQAALGRDPIWIKRGDVHAERSEDVVAAQALEVPRALDAFRARGIGRISLQQHVRGPVVKFYATADRRFFRYYEATTGPSGATPDVNEQRLRDIAFAAAEAVGLSIFGGDVVLASSNNPVLIDLNDWPSFAPFRDDAADHIAAYALARAESHAQAPESENRQAHTSEASPHPIPFSSYASDIA